MKARSTRTKNEEIRSIRKIYRQIVKKLLTVEQMNKIKEVLKQRKDNEEEGKRGESSDLPRENE